MLGSWSFGGCGCGSSDLGAGAPPPPAIASSKQWKTRTVKWMNEWMNL